MDPRSGVPHLGMEEFLQMYEWGEPFPGGSIDIPVPPSLRMGRLSLYGHFAVK